MSTISTGPIKHVEQLKSITFIGSWVWVSDFDVYCCQVVVEELATSLACDPNGQRQLQGLLAHLKQVLSLVVSARTTSHSR